MNLDQATEEYLAGVGGQAAEALANGSLDDVRKVVDQLFERNGTGPQMYDVQDAAVARTPDSDHPGVPVRVLVPIAAPLGVAVFYHAGGFVAGSMDAVDTVARKLAERTSYLVVTVDYRLAPEHPYPAAVEDAEVALQWAHDQRAGWGLPGRPLVVIGDGSGADLATVVARRAAASGRARPDLQVLVGPLLDAGVTHSDHTGPTIQGVVTLPALRKLWDWYAPGADQLDGDASALRARDLSGMPPTLLITPECDPLSDSADKYAARLTESGVEVVHRRHAGQVRCFMSLLELRYGEKAFSQSVQAMYGLSVLSSRVPAANGQLLGLGVALERLVSK